MTEIDVISGFLGAGKTTLIKKLINEVYSGEKIVLIENEFGEVGIDGGFLKDAGIEISEMNSGCICCSLVGDFGKNLREVIERFQPERILIEPSGVGKLSDVIKSIEEVEQEQDVKLQGLITVVNTPKALKQMRAFGEFFNNQISYAKTIVLSRTQDLEEKVIQNTVTELQKKNEKAVVVTTPWDQITGKQLKEAILASGTLEEKLLDEHHEHGEGCGCHGHGHHHEHGEGCGCHEHGHHHEHGKDCGCHEHGHHHEHGENCSCHEHGHHHHHADDVFSSWGLETPKKYTKEEVEQAMQSFCSTNDYGTILRAKGMIDGMDGTWIYFDLVDGEYEIRTGQPDYTGRICVIGTQLEKEKLSELFH